MATNSAKARPQGSRLERLANSPRAQRQFTIVSAIVLLVGVVAFMLAYVFHNRTDARPLTTNPSPGPLTHVQQVKPSKDAYQVIREFLATAVSRKNLHQAYLLVAPPLKAGETRKEWESGNNPVIPFPVLNPYKTTFDVLSSTKKKLYVRTILATTKKGLKAGNKPGEFFIEVTRQPDGRWLVDYFEANPPIKIPAGFG
jgi:hypothetical protein